MSPAAAGVDRLGFDEWAREHRPALLRTALAITRDRDNAEDLVQATLTKVYLAWDRVRDQGALDGYVRRVMVNTQWTWWRRGWRRREIACGTDVAADLESGDDGFSGIEARDELAPLLRALPEHQRAALTLRYLRDRSVDETAALLGLSTGPVTSQTSRGIATMRRMDRPLTAVA
jgi:RNA polymerase sigma-70 factor (sigma-E family)